ncbi:sugar phosphate isomerase/epimerase family protein [Sinomonas sp. G460-2]|uniref:sugar phosphate isomerase/epimerase family protein n=1 Tax=Sinomonas sp. G460-2 TaxID=3393464 RepID=UPI0039F02CA7
MAYSAQLYTVRDAVEADLPDAVRRLAEIGFTQVEPYDFVARAEEFAAAFAENGITAPSGHAPLLTADQDEIFAAANRLGIGIVIDPYIPAEHWRDPEAIQETATRLNAATRKAAEHGVRAGYHNHWWEFTSKVRGTTALEYFAGLLDPEVVLEIDAYWAVVGGEDPLALLERLGDRVVALHIKDGPVHGANVERLVNAERLIPEDYALAAKAQQPAGQGEVGVWGAVIDAATTLEVAVVEFDDYSADIFDGLSASLRYLEALAVDWESPK